MTAAVSNPAGIAPVGLTEPGAVGLSATPAGSLLPAPKGGGIDADAMSELYLMMSELNKNETEIGKAKVEAANAERKNRLEEFKKALERAQKAAEEKTGFFDAIGVAGLVGITVANPWLVIGDMGMHMARLTPDVVRDFEKDHANEIELAAKIWFAYSNASALLEPSRREAMAAAIALAGLIVKETEVFGNEASEYAGTAMMFAGSGRTGSRTEFALTVLADKEGVIADDIRKAEKESAPYTEYVAIAAMIAAAAAAAVGTFGTASFALVAVGIVLSAGGFALTKSEDMQEALGLSKQAAALLGAGLMIGGGIMTGAGAINGVSTAAKVLGLGAEIVSGACQVRMGANQIENATVGKMQDDANTDAKEAKQRMDRLSRAIDTVLQELSDVKDSFRRSSKLVNEIVETQANTLTIAASGVRG